ncbi:MAG: DNA alkylation repair protein [Coriobacteriales bacterium]|jgi:hypothetical protein|nr:DNA alkylation repair protein [Coriobacteriales bacterium]
MSQKGEIAGQACDDQTGMALDEVLAALESLGTERMKKQYMGRGAREPLFGVATGAMKPLTKKLKGDQALAEELMATGNYDAMYFAGTIADARSMTEADFDRWIDLAYFSMLSDFVVAVTLAESDCAQVVAGRWIQSDRELCQSAGWSCYEWLLGWRPDSYFEREEVLALLTRAEQTIHNSSDHVRRVMHSFVIAVGVSYLPLHEEAVATAERIGTVTVAAKKGTCALTPAAETILGMREKGKLGFKRKAVRC